MELLKLLIASFFLLNAQSEPNEHCLYYEAKLKKAERSCEDARQKLIEENANYEKCIANSKKNKSKKQRKICETISDRVMDLVTKRTAACKAHDFEKEDFPPECGE